MELRYGKGAQGAARPTRNFPSARRSAARLWGRALRIEAILTQNVAVPGQALDLWTGVHKTGPINRVSVGPVWRLVT
jgi:hypothetical protein